MIAMALNCSTTRAWLTGDLDSGTASLPVGAVTA